MIRQATAADCDVVVDMMVRYVARTPYGRILWQVKADANKLFWLSMKDGFTLVDEVPNATLPTGLELAGAIVVVAHNYMGTRLAEEVGHWHESPRGVLRLAEAAERQAVQIRAEVLKMSAPSWTALDGFYARRGFEGIETVWAKVLTDGPPPDCRHVDRRSGGVLPGPQEGQGSGDPSPS